MKQSPEIKWAGGGIFSFALLVSLGYAVWPKSNSSLLPLGKVEKRDLVQRVTIAGTVTPQRKTLVSAPYNGYVKQVFVNVGDQVKPGQPLVSVTQSLQSNEPVYPLRAPYSGTVMHVQKHEGDNVKENDVNDYLMRIDDTSKYFVEATAPEIDRVKLKKGQETLIKVSAVLDKSYKGVIRELTLAPKGGGDGGSGSQQEYPVRIEVTDKDEKLGPGMSAVIDIITARKESVLTLRHEFVNRDEKGSYYVELPDGSRKPVKVGMQNEEAFEIVEGVPEGTQVKQMDFSSFSQAE